MYQSTIINFVLAVFSRLAYIFSNSKTFELIVLSFEKLQTLLSGSKVIMLARTNEKTSLFFGFSFFYNLIQNSFNQILRFAKFVATLFHHSIVGTLIQNSMSWFLIETAVKRFTVVLGSFIFILSVVPDYLWHNQYSVVLTAFIVFLYIKKYVADARFGLYIKKLDFAFVLFVLTIFIASFTSITPLSSIKTFAFNITIFIFVLIMIHSIKNKEELGVILYFMIAAVTAASFYGFGQAITGVEVDPLLIDVNVGEAKGRIFSTMGNANNYAEFLVMILPFYGAAYLNTQNKKIRGLIAGLAVLPLTNLFLTLSRGGWIALLVAAFVFILIKDIKKIPFIIILGIMLLPFTPASIVERLQTIGKDTSSLYRVDIWKVAWKILKDYWTTGIGVGPEPFIRFYREYGGMASKPPPHAHMLPLQIWLEFGLVGLAVFTWFIIRIVKKGLKGIRRRRDTYLGNIMIASIASFAGILTIGLVEYVWFYPRVMNVFWIVTGIFLCALNMVFRQPSSIEVKT